MLTTRRRFLSFIGAGATAVIASPIAGMASTLSDSKRPPRGEIWIPPPLKPGGHFGRHAVLERISQGLAVNGGDVPKEWATLRYWDQIADCLSQLSTSALISLLKGFYSDVLHGQEHSSFAFRLARASRLMAHQSEPSSQEAMVLSQFLFATPARGVKILERGEETRGLARFDLMLEVNAARALPRLIGEFDGEMVAAVTGLHYAAFRDAMRRMTPLINALQSQTSLSAANVGDAVIELLLGGIQSISYQTAIGRKTEAVLLADLLGRGYLLLGRDANNTMVFFPIPTANGEGRQ